MKKERPYELMLDNLTEYTWNNIFPDSIDVLYNIELTTADIVCFAYKGGKPHDCCRKKTV